MRPNRVALQTNIQEPLDTTQPVSKPLEQRASSSSTTTYKVKTNGGNLHVRSGPSTSYKILTKMPNGTTFNVTETKSGWGKHTYNGKTGWSSLQYAKKVDSSTSNDSKYSDETSLEGDVVLREPKPKIKAKKGVTLQGLGSKISGLYYVERVKHTFTPSGYKQTLTVTRSWKGESMKNGSTNTSSNSSTSNQTKPQVQPQVTTKTYTIKKGDTLWAIAKKYYGNGSQYTKIYNANKDKISNPNKIYPGQVIKIP